MTEERILNAISAAGLIPSSQSLADFYRQTEADGFMSNTLTVQTAAA
jgi:hypothetical protein